MPARPLARPVLAAGGMQPELRCMPAADASRPGAAQVRVRRPPAPAELRLSLH